MAYNRVEKSRFLTGVLEDLVEYCRAAMLHDNMDLRRLMVHAQQVEESRRKKGELRKERSLRLLIILVLALVGAHL